MEEEWWEYGQEWITRIKGEAKNNSGQVCSPAIAAKLFNYNDVMIEKRYDFLWDMGVDETWEFEIVYYGEQIKRYEVWVDEIY